MKILPGVSAAMLLLAATPAQAAVYITAGTPMPYAVVPPPPPGYVLVAPAPYPAYPAYYNRYYYDRHHYYDWRYWHDHVHHHHYDRYSRWDDRWDWDHDRR